MENIGKGKCGRCGQYALRRYRHYWALGYTALCLRCKFNEHNVPTNKCPIDPFESK